MITSLVDSDPRSTLAKIDDFVLTSFRFWITVRMVLESHGFAGLGEQIDLSLARRLASTGGSTEGQ